MKKTLYKKIISSLLIFLIFLLIIPCHISFAQTTGNIEASPGLEANKEYWGFKLISSKNIFEINSKVMIFNHEKTGARLMFIKNNDNERVFSISFRTPAADDTGVNHIIEHSVLNGSRNYPVKSPFAEMLKRSLGTFINAMTSNDFTIYPVSSVNEKDLQNLMSVYLDAVFYPNLHTDDNIFKQEAWRYQLDTKESTLKINGIVFNEMKGYYGNPLYVLDREVNKSLFPDTSYKWDAGGNPDMIPTLTPEKFREVHKKYYTPSNSYIYLYGNLEIEKYLQFIDTNYLSKMTKTVVDTNLESQKPFDKMVEKVSFYPVKERNILDRKTYLSLSFATGSVTDRDMAIGMDYLSYLLLGSENSPLTKALFKSGIADDFTCSFKPGGVQPVFTISAINSEETSKESFKKIIFDTLNEITLKGFDKQLLKYTLTQYDLKKRVERISSKKGLNLNFNVMQSWIYDENPTLFLEESESIEKINKLAYSGYFEDLIRKYLLNNGHSSLVVLKPSPGLQSRVAISDNDSLEKYKNSLDPKAIKKLIKETKKFYEWQHKQDSKKALKTIPQLKLSDIKVELPDLKLKTENINGINVLYHNTNLKGLSGVNFYFDTSKVPQDKLYYLNLLSSILSNVDTRNYKLGELTNELYSNCSGIRISAAAINNSKNPDIYTPFMKVSFLSLDENLSKSMELMEEIINNSVLDNKIKVYQILQQNKLQLRNAYTSGEGLYASLKLNSYLTEYGRYNEALSGPGYYEFLSVLDRDFENKWEDILSNLNEVYSLVFNKNGLTVSHNGNNKGAEIFRVELEKIIPKFNAKTVPVQNYSFCVPDKNIALPLPVKVQTLFKGGSFARQGYSYNGRMLVLQRILNMDYLWNTIRTSGGAYGCNVSFSRNGLITFMSTRDPNLSETLKAFDGTVKYLKEFEATEEEMENFIIGTLGEFLKIKSMGPLYESSLSNNMYFSKLASEDLINTVNEVLSTKAEDIRRYSDMLEEVLKVNIYYVEGSQEKINENKDLFTRFDSLPD